MKIFDSSIKKYYKKHNVNFALDLIAFILPIFMLFPFRLLQLNRTFTLLFLVLLVFDFLACRSLSFRRRKGVIKGRRSRTIERIVRFGIGLPLSIVLISTAPFGAVIGFRQVAASTVVLNSSGSRESVLYTLLFFSGTLLFSTVTGGGVLSEKVWFSSFLISGLGLSVVAFVTYYRLQRKETLIYLRKSRLP